MNVNGDQTFESEDIGLRQGALARVLSRGSLAAFSAMIFVLGLAEVIGKLAALTGLAALVWLVALVGSFVASAVELGGRGRIRISPAGVVIERRGQVRGIAHAAMLSAHRIDWTVSGAMRSSVELVLRDGDRYQIECASPGAADVLVSALGFGPGGRRQTIDLARPGRRALNLLTAFVAYMLTNVIVVVPLTIGGIVAHSSMRPVQSLMYLPIALLLPLVYFWLRRRWAAPEVEIGDDGLTVLEKGKRRFHRQESLREVRAIDEPGRRGLFGDSGDSALATGRGLDRDKVAAAARTMSARWWAARGATSPLAEREVRVATFARAGRPLATWRADIAKQMAAGGGYREEAVTADEVEAILRSPTATTDARIGAAFALAAVGERVRIAAAAEPLAEPRLRVALEAVARGRETDRMIEALADGETPSVAARARS